jgi:hypothetical protein|tara:strand:+ start:3345 stop:4022 length:678 start_codon:yes stop_codon:yes gene_type:complete
MIKLKKILKEGFSWERNADGSLPTLADATKNHQKNLQEQSLNRLQPLIDMGFELEKMSNGQTVATLEKGSNNVILIIGTNAVFKGLYTIAGKKGMLAGTIDDKYMEIIKAKVAKMGITEVLKDKDGNVRTDLKYKDNQNYQPRIELKNTKMGSGTNLTITVSIDGSAPFDIEFDDYDEVDDHGYEKAIYLMGADDGGNEWGMEGSMAFHGELEDFEIDTLEKMEK